MALIDDSKCVSSDDRAVLRRGDQLTIAILALVLGGMLLGHWLIGFVIRDQLIEIDRVPPRRVDFVIRLNDAKWPELTALPGIGETLARRIVADRSRNGPFPTIDDLQRVKGIGPKTIRRIGPWLSVP